MWTGKFVSLFLLSNFLSRILFCNHFHTQLPLPHQIFRNFGISPLSCTKPWDRWWRSKSLSNHSGSVGWRIVQPLGKSWFPEQRPCQNTSSLWSDQGIFKGGNKFQGKFFPQFRCPGFGIYFSVKDSELVQETDFNGSNSSLSVLLTYFLSLLLFSRCNFTISFCHVYLPCQEKLFTCPNYGNSSSCKKKKDKI